MHLFLLLAATIMLDPGGVFRVSGWKVAATSPADYSQRLSVYVEPRAPDAPALLGSYSIDRGRDELVFRPQFPLQAGAKYRAIFRPPDGGAATEQVFEMPAAAKRPPTQVEGVFPTAPELPANTLKFYIYFSAPMSHGEAYQHIRLLDASNKPVDLPFLEIAEELWDPASKRFTLLFNPGRIKRGLVPNQEMGQALTPGKRYTLLIDSNWPDAYGQPLEKDFRRTFTVQPDERRVVDVRTWRLLPPPAASKYPLQVRFPRPLDRALLDHSIEVLDPSGRAIDGAILVDGNEQRWQFTPTAPWRAGAYQLRVNMALEDLAGNKVDRPFDVDVFEHIDKTIRAETKSIAFTVR